MNSLISNQNRSQLNRSVVNTKNFAKSKSKKKPKSILNNFLGNKIFRKEKQIVV